MKLSPTARVIFQIGREAFVAAGGHPYNEEEMSEAHVAAFNRIAEWHEGKLGPYGPDGDARWSARYGGTRYEV